MEPVTLLAIQQISNDRDGRNVVRFGASHSQMTISSWLDFSSLKGTARGMIFIETRSF